MAVLELTFRQGDLWSYLQKEPKEVVEKLQFVTR